MTQDEQTIQNNAIEALCKLRALLSDEGEYCIRRSDGEGMGLGEAIMLGDIFDAIAKWLDAQPQREVSQ